MSQFNVLIVGNAGTGKTKFISQVIYRYFNKHYTPTLIIKDTHIDIILLILIFKILVVI